MPVIEITTFQQQLSALWVFFFFFCLHFLYKMPDTGHLRKGDVTLAHSLRDSAILDTF